MTIESITLLIFAILIFVGGAAFVILSLIEKEKRAAIRGALLTFPFSALYSTGSPASRSSPTSNYPDLLSVSWY